MKQIISALSVLALAISALGQTQGVSMRATNGIGYGTTVINSLVGKITTGNVTNASGSRVAYLSDTNGLSGPYTNNSTGNPGTVTGSGISTNTSNLAVLASVNTFTANNVFPSISFPTNQAVLTIDMTKAWAGLSTNANINIAGFSGIDSTGTNVQSVIRVYTNSAGSASVKTIGMPSGCVDLLNTGLTLYNTNQGVLTVAVIPGFGTNFSWIGK